MISYKKTWFLAGLLCLTLWPGATHGQSSEFDDAYNRFSELYAQGRYQEALPFAKKALGLGEQEFGPDHSTTATLLNNLATLYQAQGRYSEAEQLHRRALVIFEKTLGPEHLHVATSLDNLAGLYRSQGKYAEAEPLYKRSLAIREKALGPEHPDVATSLNNLAGLYQARAKATDIIDQQTLLTSAPEKLAAMPSQPPSNDLACLQGGFVRIIRVKFSGLAGEPPCSVVYEKSPPEEPSIETLWRSHSEKGFCEAQAGELVEKLRGWNWTCGPIGDVLGVPE